MKFHFCPTLEKFWKNLLVAPLEKIFPTPMVVLLFSDTFKKRNKRQLYLLTCRKCYLLLLGLSDTYLHV